MRKIVSLFILLVLFVQFLGLVFAQNIPGPGDTIPTAPQINSGPTEQEIQEFAAERAQKLVIWNTVVWIVAALSLAIGFFITKKMIKINPKITNWILHSIILLASLILLIATLIDGIRCLTSLYCGFPSEYYFIWVITFFSTIFSILVIRGFIKNKVDNVYSVNMSSSTIFMWLIFILITPVAEFIVRPDFDIPAFLILPLFGGIITLAIYFILGTMGYFIDKSKLS